MATEPPGPRSYLICMTPRTGSTLLCRSLVETGIAGNPAEHFLPDVRHNRAERWGLRGIAAYANWLVETTQTRNQTFGLKIGWLQFKAILDETARDERLKGLSEPERVERLFPNLRYVYLTRRSRVRQAISDWKARQSQVYHVEVGDEFPKDGGRLCYDYHGIDAVLRGHDLQKAEWRHYFERNDLRPVRVVYEKLIGDLEGTVSALLQAVGVERSLELRIGPPRLQRMSDALTERWVRRFWIRSLLERGPVLLRGL